MKYSAPGVIFEGKVSSVGLLSSPRTEPVFGVPGSEPPFQPEFAASAIEEMLISDMGWPLRITHRTEFSGSKFRTTFSALVFGPGLMATGL